MGVREVVHLTASPGEPWPPPPQNPPIDPSSPQTKSPAIKGNYATFMAA